MPVAFIKTQDIVKKAAELLHVGVTVVGEAGFYVAVLKVSKEGLDKALCTHSTLTRGEVIVSPIKKVDATDVRDAFVKGIYGRTFVWIVEKINKAIFKPKEDRFQKRFSIGVLDIFGFENFRINRYIASLSVLLLRHVLNLVLNKCASTTAMKIYNNFLSVTSSNWNKLSMTERRSSGNILSSKTTKRHWI